MSFCMRMAVAALTAFVLMTGAHEAAAEAEILWDTNGVPHIYAKDDPSAFRAFGWAQMQLRGDLILKLYGRARGEAADYWGEEYLPSDVVARSFDVPRRAQWWLAQLGADERKNLNEFVAGMNAWAEANPEALAPEMRTVLPIRLTDPLAHLHQIVHLAFIGGEAIEMAASGAGGAAAPGASNAYAIAPSRSESGNAMLVINPHLPWRDLFTWVEAGIEMPSATIYGVALVGSPFIGIGFNELGGWTHTVNQYDGADVYELRLADGGYVLDGEVRPFETRDLVFRVRGRDGAVEERTIPIRSSVHGPVLRQEGDRAWAVRIAAWEVPDMMRQYIEMASAPDLERFEAAQGRLQMPFFNTLYANRAGEIFYLHGGHLPDRQLGDWSFWQGVIPGDRGAFLWPNLLPYTALPRIRNPQSGFLQNANDPPWSVTFPFVVSPADYPLFVASPPDLDLRAQRSLGQVLADQSISFDELVTMKMSNRLELADRILDDLLAAALTARDPDAIRGRQILESWDRAANAHSRGAILFMAWAERMWAAEEEEGLRFFASNWREDRPVTTPDGLADPTRAVAELGRAVNEVRSRHGSPSVAYGEVVRLRRGTLDLPASGGDDEYGAYRIATGPEGKDGVTTVTRGDSFAAVVEFGPKVRAKGLLSYGNSADPQAPANRRQLELFSRGEMRPIHFYREDVESHLDRREVVR